MADFTIGGSCPGSTAAAFVEPCTRAIEFSLAHSLYDQAVFFAERLAAHLPGSEEALLSLAAALLRKGDAARAHALLQERRSSNPRLRYLLAASCLQLDKPKEAESALLGNQASSSEALSAVAGGGPGLYLLGQAKERLNSREQAVECYAKCLEICPFMWSAYERLSWLSLSLKPAPTAARASVHFSEEKFAQDTVLHPTAHSSPGGGQAAGQVLPHPPPAAQGAHSENALSPVLAAVRHTLGDWRNEATVQSARKRRRSRSKSPPKPYAAAAAGAVGGAIGSPLASPPPPMATSPGSRVPLADRSLVAQTPLRPPRQETPTAESEEAALPLGMRTPVRLLSRLAPRKLFLPRRRSRSWSLLPRSPSHAFLEDHQSPPRLTSLDDREKDARVPTLASLLRKLGEALHCMHSFACSEALEVLRLLPAHEQDSAFVQDLAARCHFELAEYSKAAECYARCSESHLHYRAMGLEYYSTALWHLRDGLELSCLAQRSLEWDRSAPKAWCAAGNCFSLQGEQDQAIRCFRRSLQLDGSFAYAYTLIAHEFVASDKFDKAIQMYERAIGVDCRHYNAWWGLGNVYYRQEEYKNALYNFQRAADINGSNAILRSSLGMAWKALDQPQRALEFFSSAAESQHCSALATLQKGSTLVALGRHAEAVEELRRAQSLAPREPSVHFHLGRAHAGAGDQQKALLHLTMAMDLCGSRDSKDQQLILQTQRDLLQAAGAPSDLGASQVTT